MLLQFVTCPLVTLKRADGLTLKQNSHSLVVLSQPVHGVVFERKTDKMNISNRFIMFPLQPVVRGGRC